MKLIKADLHLHTQESKIGSEVFFWNGIQDSIKILYKHQIKVFSFTDHNRFNIDFYNRANEIINKYSLDMKIIPGVEISMLNKNGMIGHVIFYFKPNVTNEELQIIKKIIETNANFLGTNITQFICELNNYNISFALIVHIGKDNYITYEDFEALKQYVYCVEGNINHPKFKQFMKKQPNFKRILFSDTHIWNKYHDPHQTIDYTEFMNFINKSKEK